MHGFTVFVACVSIGLSAGAMAQTQATPANAPAAASTPELKAGMKIYDPEGAEVGTIGSVSGGNAVVSIDAYSIALPAAAFAKTDKGLVIGATRAQVVAAAEKAANANAANLAAALQANAEVRSIGGTAVVGTVKSTDSEFVTLATSSGEVRLPRSALVMGSSGPAVNMTAEQFQAALTQAIGAQAATGSPSGG